MEAHRGFESHRFRQPLLICINILALLVVWPCFRPKSKSRLAINPCEGLYRPFVRIQKNRFGLYPSAFDHCSFKIRWICPRPTAKDALIGMDTGGCSFF